MLLLKNEMRKISKWKLFFIWLGSLVIIFGITGIIIMGLERDGKIGTIVRANVPNFHDTGNSWSGWSIAATLFSTLFTKVVFLLFEAYLISSIVIDEFRKKTIQQLFSYPYRKSSIIWSKIIGIILISFVAQISAHFAIQSVIMLIVFLSGTTDVLAFSFFIHLFVVTLGTVLIGLVPLVFGLLKHSTVVTMLSALVLAGLISNAMPGMLSKSFVNDLPFLFLSSVISISMVALSVHSVSKKDVDLH